MNAEVEGLQDQLLSIRQDAPGLASGLSDEQFNWRPAPSRWSIAECFGHLNASAAAFMPRFAQAVAEGRERGLTSPGPYTYPVLERLFVRLMEPPPKIRVRTPGAFVPSYGATPAIVVHEFMSWQGQLQECLSGSDGLDLRRVRVRSPFASWLTYSLGTAFAAFLAHERRHIWQARQVRKHTDFPAHASPDRAQGRLSA